MPHNAFTCLHNSHHTTPHHLARYPTISTRVLQSVVIATELKNRTVGAKNGANRHREKTDRSPEKVFAQRFPFIPI